MALINFSGIASGIDSAALIDAIIEQKRTASVAPLETKAQGYEDTNTSLGELKTLVTELRDLAAKFRTINGGAISKEALSSNEAVLSAVAANFALSGSYSLNVTALASNATLSFNDRFSSSSDVIYAGMDNTADPSDRTVTITTGIGAEAESVSVILNSSSTVADLVNEFNSKSSKAVASIVNVGSGAAPSYAIIINSNETGTSKGEIAINVGSAVSDGGSGAFVTNELRQASDATFTMDGISGPITRATNSIGDVISGVTLNLQSTGTARLTVANNSEETIATLQEMVDKYNEIVKFVAENDAITVERKNGQNINVFGPLATTSLDDSLLSSLRSTFASSKISGGNFNILADLGITTERDGTIKFNEETFTDAFSKNPSDVQAILENLGENLAAPGGTIDNYTRFNGLFDATVNANKSAISSLQSRIGDLEARLDKEKQNLTSLYARLESLIGSMQQQQNALIGILPTNN
ncbi:MAG: flagellar filament capping protein FliD [Deltaproteobacteria bacterium]|nr:flagellar filament capping protein FliD [Deltaproteobacteria bacterium]